MDQHPDLVEKWVKGHVEIINYINNNLTEAKEIFNKEFQRETGKALPASYLDASFERIVFTAESMESSVHESANRAFEIGYLGREKVDLKNLYELSFLTRSKSENQ